MALNPDDYAPRSDVREQQIQDVLDWWNAARNPDPGQEDLTAVIPVNPSTLVPHPVPMPAPVPTPVARPGGMPGPVPVMSPTFPVPRPPVPGTAPSMIGSQEGVPGPEVAGPTGQGVPDTGTIGAALVSPDLSGGTASGGLTAGLTPPPTPPAPAAVDDVQAARRDADAALQGAAVAGATASQVKGEVANNALDREARAVEDHARAMAESDARYQTARAAARLEAKGETERWMNSMEQYARAEPNPGRYWGSQDTFGKALWILGMAFSGAAQIGMKNPGENPAINLLQHTIAQDVASQRDSIRRQGDVLKAKGDIMARNQASVLEDLRDDRSQGLLRLNALGEALKLRAAKMTPEELARTGTADALNYVAQQKVAGAQRREQEAFHAREAQLTRAQQAHEGALNRGNAITLANIREKGENDRAQARLDATAAKEKADRVKESADKERKVLDKSLGVTVSVPNPVTGRLELKEFAYKGNEGVHKAVADTITRANDYTASLREFRAAVADASTADLLGNMNPRVKAAQEKLAGAMAKQLNSGSMSENDRKVGYVANEGLDPHSWIDLIKTGGKDAILQTVDRNLRNVSGETSRAILAHAGVSLEEAYGKGATLQYVPPPNLNAQEPADATTHRAQAEAGVAGPVTYAVTPEDVRRRRALGGSGALQELPPEISVGSGNSGNTPGEKALGNFPALTKNAPPDKVHATAQSALDALEAYRKEHPNAAAMVTDARARLVVAEQDARAAASKRAEQVAEKFTGAKWQTIVAGGTDPEGFMSTYLPEEATKAGLDVSNAEDRDNLLRYVRERQAFEKRTGTDFREAVKDRIPNALKIDRDYGMTRED